MLDVSLPQLRQHWYKAMEQGKVNKWGEVAGPVDAVRMTAKRMGWQCDHPWEWKDEEGIDIMLREISPQMLKWHVHNSYVRKMERKMAAKWEDPSLLAPVGPEGEVPNRKQRVDVCTVRKLLRSKGKEAMDEEAKGFFKAAVCDAMRWLDHYVLLQ